VKSLFCVALVLAGCAAGPVSLAPPPRPLTAKDYHRTFERWTREGRIIYWKDYDTVLVVDATLRSAEFQSAYAARYIDLYQIDNPREIAQVQDQAMQRTRDGISFLLQSTGHGYNGTDFSPSRGLWRLVLLDDTGTETPPTEISLLRTPKDVATERYTSDLRTLMTGPMARLWSVTFPNRRADGQPLLRPDLRRLVLRIAGPQGKTDMTWDLQ
jgi:hypothetical protein